MIVFINIKQIIFRKKKFFKEEKQWKKASEKKSYYKAIEKMTNC